MKKRKARKPHEIIYISSFGTHTLEDGDITTLIALDEYSEFLFEPVVASDSSVETVTADIKKLFDNIRKKYNAKKHAQTTTYVTDFPENLHFLMKAVMRDEDSLVYHPAKTRQKIKPILELFESYRG